MTLTQAVKVYEEKVKVLNAEQLKTLYVQLVKMGVNGKLQMIVLKAAMALDNK